MTVIFLNFYLNTFLDCTRINDPRGTFQSTSWISVMSVSYVGQLCYVGQCSMTYGTSATTYARKTHFRM